MKKIRWNGLTYMYLERLIESHGFSYSWINGRIYILEKVIDADFNVHKELTDITDYTIEDFKTFLGY